MRLIKSSYLLSIILVVSCSGQSLQKSGLAVFAKLSSNDCQQCANMSNILQTVSNLTGHPCTILVESELEKEKIERDLKSKTNSTLEFKVDEELYKVFSAELLSSGIIATLNSEMIFVDDIYHVQADDLFGLKTTVKSIQSASKLNDSPKDLDILKVSNGSILSIDAKNEITVFFGGKILLKSHADTIMKMHYNELYGSNSSKAFSSVKKLHDSLKFIQFNSEITSFYATHSSAYCLVTTDVIEKGKKSLEPKQKLAMLEIDINGLVKLKKIHFEKPIKGSYVIDNYFPIAATNETYLFGVYKYLNIGKKQRFLAEFESSNNNLKFTKLISNELPEVFDENGLNYQLTQGTFKYPFYTFSISDEVHNIADESKKSLNYHIDLPILNIAEVSRNGFPSNIEINRDFVFDAVSFTILTS
ncbi:MAG: hypothetical protein KDC92_17685, partial [Bacteroidetes bacterium]|nr:hypothetical protein [Bacteroidota bacterium]